MKKLSKTRFWIYYHAALLVFSFAAGAIMKYNQTGMLLSPETWVPFSAIFMMSASSGYVGIYLVNRAAKMSHARLTKWLVPGLLSFFLTVFVCANLSISLAVFAWFLVIGKDLGDYFYQLFHYELNFANRRLFGWLIFFSIAFFYMLWRKSAKKEQVLREEILHFQYESLKSQINPHFLFNSLNTISELVYQDVKKADQYIQELSSIYRYILDNQDQQTVTLSDELAFSQRYFNLQAVRDQGKISLVCTIENAGHYEIVPVSLQLLIENALKHNASSVKSPLVIELFLQDDYVVVRNNIQRKSILEESTGKGLRNLKERIRMIMNREMITEENHLYFLVKVPVNPVK